MKVIFISLMPAIIFIKLNLVVEIIAKYISIIPTPNSKALLISGIIFIAKIKTPIPLASKASV